MNFKAIVSGLLLAGSAEAASSARTPGRQYENGNEARVHRQQPVVHDNVIGRYRLPASEDTQLRGFDFEYSGNGTTWEGYAVAPEGGARSAPVLLMAHQWLGLGDNEKYWAEVWAREGFFTFATDIFGKGNRWTAPTDEQRELVSYLRANPLVVRERMSYALAALSESFPGEVDMDNVSAMGFCFGGGTVMELARGQADGLRAIMSFHGAPLGSGGSTPGTISPDVYVQINHAGNDDAAHPGDLEKTIEELENAGSKVWQTMRYGNVPHGYTNPNSAAFDPVATSTSMAAAGSLLDMLFPQSGKDSTRHARVAPEPVHGHIDPRWT